MCKGSQARDGYVRMDVLDESGALSMVPACWSEEVYYRGESSPWEIEVNDNHMSMFSLQEPVSLHERWYGAVSLDLVWFYGGLHSLDSSRWKSGP